MDQRLEIIKLAMSEEANITKLSERFGISRKSVYNWINRFRGKGADGLYDLSTRPLNSPLQTHPAMEKLVLDLRDKHPAWGGRKIKRRLEDLDHSGVPCASTITEILRRGGRLDPSESEKHKPWIRFACNAPNDHWQMDFKGHFPLVTGARCHPLTVLDDCSRFNLALEACSNERRDTVRGHLERAFRRYGLPDAMVVDNGSPWSYPRSRTSFTALAIWLIRLGVRLIRITEYHPQTNGKIERLHRSLKAEVLQGREFKSFEECREAFDEWRYVYNFERPHESLGLNVPSRLYEMSVRSYPDKLPEIEYGPGDHVRKVQYGGLIAFHGNFYKVGKAFKGLPVALRPVDETGVFDVYFMRQKLLRIYEYVVPPRGDI